VQVIAIGMGEPKHAVRYCHKLAPKVECLVQNNTEPYKIYGIHHGNLNEVFSLDLLKAGLRSISQGHLPGQPTGDVQMMPATFVVDTHGIITYTYYSKHPGDHPEIPVLLGQVKQLKA
jgi:hypothetical protein